jgi:predicted ATPase
MATVYRAHQPSMERYVAVKVIYQELADETGREQFQREARLIARLEHPHILPIYDFDGQSRPPYIVTRYLGGGTLKDALSHLAPNAIASPMHWRTGLRWLSQIGEALDYAHRQGITHRDIKPSNIILDRELNAFLADFGIALLSDELTALSGGEVLGTPMYAAPEQAIGSPEIGPAADLYALAVVAFEIFTGTLPFEADSLSDLLLKHAHEPPPPITRRNPALPSKFDQVMLKGLAKPPLERYPSARALVEAISFALGLTFSRPLTLSENRVSAVETPLEQNKVITVLCADAADFAAWATEQPAASHLLTRLWDKLIPLAQEHGGQVLERGEDTLTVAWGVTTTNEDDPEQAVRVGLLWHEHAGTMLAEAETALSVGAHTGPATLTRQLNLPTYTVTGPALLLAQRLAENAEGAVLISLDTARPVQGIFDLTPEAPLKARGRKEPLIIYRVAAIKKRAFHLGFHGVEGMETPFVGREGDLKLLQRAFLTTVDDAEAQTVTLLGEAGLGKSRLLTEFTRWVDLHPTSTWLFQGRATPTTVTRPYALLRDVLSSRFEILDNDPPITVQHKMQHGLTELLSAAPEIRVEAWQEMVDLVGYLVGFEFPESPYVAGLRGDPKQLAARARQLAARMWAAAAAQSPVMIQIEDAHWADTASLELFHAIARENPRLPILLLVLARPGFFEAHPAWAGGLDTLRRGATPNQHLIELRPLDRHDSRDLARTLLRPIPELPRELRDLLVDRAEGNPLFMEELVKMLIEDRVILKVSAEVWRVEASRLAHLRVPTSLVSLLQARLDTLLAPEKAVLQRAAVVGKVFYDSALRALDTYDDLELGNLDPVLDKLVERGFVHRRGGSAFAGSREYVFAQAMLREALYAALPTRQQRRYHSGVAAWLNAISGERRGEYLALIAEHYEKAGETPRAITALREAGEWALNLSAFAEAKEYFARGLVLARAWLQNATPALTPLTRTPTAHDDTLHKLSLEIRLGEAHQHLAEYEAAQQHLHSALATARELGATAQVALALSLLGDVAFGQGDFAACNRYNTEILSLTQTLGDQFLLARVLFQLGYVAWRMGTPETARQYFTQCRALARAIGDQHRELYAINGLGIAARLENQLDHSEAYFQEALALALKLGNRERAMTALNNLGTIADERPHFPAALDNYRRALAIAQEIGSQDSAALLLLNLANTLIKVDQFDEARRCTKDGLALALRLGATPWVLWGLLVHARFAAVQGDVPRALALLGLADRHPTANNDLRRNMQNLIHQCGIDPALVEPGMAKGAELNFETTLKELTE